MKVQLKPFVVSLFLLGMISVPAVADTTSDHQSVEAISSRTQNLEAQLNTLQTELHQLKGQLKNTHKASHKKAPQSASHRAWRSSQSNPASNSGPDSYIEPQHGPMAGLQYFPIDVDVPGQSFVSSGPYIGVPFVYSGGELIINTPSINEDVALLNIRKEIKLRLQSLGRPEAADHAHLLLSGIVEGQAIYKHPGEGPASSDIDLTSAELDGYILGPSSWTSGIISFAYDNNIGANTGSLNNNARTQNSRVFINKAFIVIGNFLESPIYGTLGQMYVPFGTYSTNMISSPLTKMLARTKTRAVLLGYQEQGQKALYGSTYLFRGDTYVGSTSRLNNGGVNLGYRYGFGQYSGDFGGGLIANIADSDGMQNNGYDAPYFGGFGATRGYGSEQINHRVPAMNLHGTFNVGDHITLLAEYVGSLNAFNKADMIVNSHGARPKAVRGEAAYTFTAFDRPSSVAVGYGRSKDALALGLPQQRCDVVFNTSYWKDTLQSIEFRHDINYSSGDTASGAGSAVTQLITGIGKPDNTITAQFDLYF